MKIISISGVDGSGKSTQGELLKKYLESRGHKVMYFHAVDFSIGNLLSKKSKATEECKKEDSGDSVIKASWGAIQLRKIALLIDLLRFEFAQNKWRRDEYTHIVSDRYFYDSIINILYLSKGSKVRSFGAELLMSLIPSPTHAFFLSVPPETIMQRTRAPEQGVDYLQKKDSLFADHVKILNLTTIDGTLPSQEIFTKLKEALY